MSFKEMAGKARPHKAGKAQPHNLTRCSCAEVSVCNAVQEFLLTHEHGPIEGVPQSETEFPTTPEPGTGLLVLAGLTGYSAFRRRKQKLLVR